MTNELYDWQKEAIEACKKELLNTDQPVRYSHGSRVVGCAVAGATGTGKSRVAIELMKWYEQYNFKNIGLRSVFTIVVPTKALMLQWRDGLIESGWDAHMIGRCGGGSIKGWDNRTTDVINITTIQSLQKGKLELPRDDPLYRMGNLLIDLHMVVVDECHNLRGAKARHCLDNLEHNAIIGLSATPHPNDEARAIVEQVVGKIAYSYRYAQALKDGVIPPFVLNLVKVPMSPAENHEVEQLTQSIKRCMRDAQYDHERRNELHAIARNLGTQRKRVINRCRSRYNMARKIMIHHGNVPTLLFHESTEDVDELALDSKGFSPAVYHSNHPNKDAELERFKNRETNHLFSCLSLTEGFNVPFVQVAIMMSGPNAPLRRIQTLGRSLRGNKDEVNQVYLFYVDHKKDLEGVHNLIETADIPPEVIQHFEMHDDLGRLWTQLPPLARRKKWVPVKPRLDIYQMAEMDYDPNHPEDEVVFLDENGNVVNPLDEVYGEIPDTFDEFMQGFNQT